MKREQLTVLYKKYNLGADDVYKHNHYIIITRSGIDKIQAIEKIEIDYDVINCEPEYCVVKAKATKNYHDSKDVLQQLKIQTFGSAKYGGKEKNTETNKWIDKGTTTTWYVMEMAEKRAMSRAVLKLTGFYELGVFGEDESEDFKRK